MAVLRTCPVVIGVVLLASLAGCSAQATSLLPSPSPVAQDLVTVTVRVLVRGPNSTTPIDGARVSEGKQWAYTDAAGLARVDVRAGQPVSIRAEAEHYVGFTVDAERVSHAETWTFWLERRP